jgi:hypothetical protein
MANRTIEIYGWVESATTCSAEVSFNGNVVHSGTVPTVPAVPELVPPDAFSEGLVTFEVPVNLSGTFPVTISFTGGEEALVQRIMCNYMPIQNPIYTPEQYAIVSNATPSTRAERNAIMIPLATPPLTAEEITIVENANTTSPESQAIFNSHGIGFTVSSGPAVNRPVHLPIQAKTNVKVNGIDVTAGTEPAGEWGYVIPFTNGVGTISFDLIVDPGQE